MIFLNPLALWGLFFIAVPIIIHLFDFRRVKRVEFSNVAFLRKVEVKTGSRNKLRRLLILMCRILFILFVVLAFAQPSRNANSPTLDKAIYLDNSASMQVKNSNGLELLFFGSEALKKSFSQTISNSEVEVFTNEWNSRFYLSDRKSLSTLDGLTFSPKSVPIASVLDRLSSEQEVILISDFQKSTFGNPIDLEFDSNQFVHFKKLSAGDVSNVFVDTAYLDSPLGLPSQNKLLVQLRCVGETDRENVLVRLKRGAFQISSVAMDIPANTSVLAEFQFSQDEKIGGEYSIEVDDPVVGFDNQYFLSIPKTSNVNVIILTNGRRNSYLERAFANPALFNVQVSSISSIDSNLETAELIILNEIENIPNWLGDRLKAFGGSMLIVPSKTMNASSYLSGLGLVVRPSPDTAFYTFNRKSLEAPIFRGVFKHLTDHINLPQSKNYYLIENADPLIELSSKRAYLSRSGSIFFLSGPIEDLATTFHKHSLFLPVLYQLSIFNQGAPVLAHNLDSRSIVLKMDSLLQNGKTSLSGESGSFVPSFRYTKNAVILEIPEVLDEPGSYHLVTDGDTLRSLAFNISKQESDIRTYSVAELEEIIAGNPRATVELVTDERDLAELGDAEPEGIPLWKYALILALVFMITEILLLRFFK